LRIAAYAATYVPAQDVPHALADLAVLVREFVLDGHFTLPSLGLIAARQRVGGFADAMLDEVETSNFDEIEDELFRWARTIDANLELRRLLLDRDAPLASRTGTVEALLAGKVNDVTLHLALFTIGGGRPVTSSARSTFWSTTWPRLATGASRACTRLDHSTTRTVLTSYVP